MRVLGDIADAKLVEPSRTAIVTRKRSVTFGELDADADRIAGGLLQSGFRRGDRAVIQLPNSPEFLAVLIGMFRAGIVPVLALAAHRRHELIHVARTSGARLLVTGDVGPRHDYRVDARAVLAAVPELETVLVVGDGAEFGSVADLAGPRQTETPDLDDVALMLLSGGSTNAPKLIPRTHRQYVLQFLECAAAMGFGPDSAYLAALPMAHNAALGCPGVLGTLAIGARAIVASSPSPDETFPLLTRHGVGLTTLMPALLKLWAETAPMFGVRLEGLVIEVGGARLEPAAAARAEDALGCRVSRWFGITEGTLCFTRPDDEDSVRLSTEGRPLLAADRIRIVDDDDVPVATGESGELQISGPYTFEGYYGFPAHDAQHFCPDGFFRTGDLARVDAGGNLVVEGRRMDVINRGGEKVPAGELEDLIGTDPSVRAVCVLPVDDPNFGERTAAVVVPAGDTEVTLDRLRSLLAELGVATYKFPDVLYLVDDLPVNTLGKVDKKQIRLDVIQENTL